MQDGWWKLLTSFLVQTTVGKWEETLPVAALETQAGTSSDRARQDLEESSRTLISNPRMAEESDSIRF